MAMIASARYGRAKGLEYLATLIAISWAIGLVIVFAEAFFNFHFPAGFVIIDMVVAMLIVRRAMIPGYPGRVIFLWVATILTLQAIYLAYMETTHNPITIDAWLQKGLNYSFAVMVLSVIIYSLVRGIKVRKDERDGIDRPVWKDAKSRYRMTPANLFLFLNRWYQNTLAEFRMNTDNPDIGRALDDAWTATFNVIPRNDSTAQTAVGRGDEPQKGTAQHIDITVSRTIER
ncbi:MAG: hypothetical protein AAGB02_03025 [Pseudomonadota bacterium]